MTAILSQWKRPLFQQRSGTGEFQLALDQRFQNRPGVKIDNVLVPTDFSPASRLPLLGLGLLMISIHSL